MKLNRMDYIQEIMDAIKYYINEKQVDQLETEIRLLALKNQTLLNANTNTFLYKGVWYTAGHPTGVKGDYKPNKLLHMDLFVEMEALLNKSYDQKVDEAIIHNYLSNIFLIFENTIDLYKVLPSVIHHLLNRIDKAIFNCNKEAPDLAIIKFKEQNTEGIQLLYGAFFTRLLLSN